MSTSDRTAAPAAHGAQQVTTGQARAARALTEALAPSVWGVVVPVVFGAVTDAIWWRGALLGLLGALFAIGVPYAVILRAMRSGGVSDHHVSRREDRPKIFVLTLASLAVGLVLLGLLGAPRELLLLLVGMVVLVVVCLAITTRWKVSLHAAVAAGSVAALVQVLGPWALLGVGLVAAVGWSRVVLGDHTPAQVVVGAVVGALVLPLVLLVA